MPPSLPTEVVALVMDQLWDSLCVHPALDYLVIPERHHVHLVFGSCRLVSSTWLALATPYWNRFEKPSKKEDSKKGANVDEVVDAEALAQRRFFDLAAAASNRPLEAALMWENALARRTHLSHLSFLLDHRPPAVLPVFPLGPIAGSALVQLPVEQRRRITSALIKVTASDHEHISAPLRSAGLVALAEHLPSLRQLTLHGSAAILELGSTASPEESWWTGLQYITLINVISRGDYESPDDLDFVLTRILAASSKSLRHVELQRCDFIPDAGRLCWLDYVFGNNDPSGAPTIVYPSLTRLSIMDLPPDSSPLLCDSSYFLHRFPNLERLALHDHVNFLPYLLLYLPQTLTHLTLELASTVSAWHEPLLTFLRARGCRREGSLRYLSIDLPSFEVGVCFATTDERLWQRDGLADDYAEESGDDDDDGASSVGESEVEDGDDWDAEPEEWGAVLGARWSEGKKREVALERAVEQLRGALKPGVGLAEVELVLEHALEHVLVPVPKREKDSATALE